jgi:hypothetical protein
MEVFLAEQQAMRKTKRPQIMEYIRQDTMISCRRMTYILLMDRWIHLANLSMAAVVLYFVKPPQREWINTLSMATTSKAAA